MEAQPPDYRRAGPSPANVPGPAAPPARGHFVPSAGHRRKRTMAAGSERWRSSWQENAPAGASRTSRGWPWWRSSSEPSSCSVPASGAAWRRRRWSSSPSTPTQRCTTRASSSRSSTRPPAPPWRTRPRRPSQWTVRSGRCRARAPARWRSSTRTSPSTSRGKPSPSTTSLPSTEARWATWPANSRGPSLRATQVPRRASTTSPCP